MEVAIGRPKPLTYGLIFIGICDVGKYESAAYGN